MGGANCKCYQENKDQEVLLDESCELYSNRNPVLKS